jgi:hypothetical protein
VETGTWAGRLIRRRQRGERRGVPTSQFCDEKSKPNAHRSNKGRLCLLSRQHKHSNHELGCEEHLDEDTLGDGRAVCKGREGIEGAGKDVQDNTTCDHAGNQLGGDEE